MNNLIQFKKFKYSKIKNQNAYENLSIESLSTLLRAVGKRPVAEADGSYKNCTAISKSKKTRNLPTKSEKCELKLCRTNTFCFI